MGLHKNLTNKLYENLRTRDVWPGKTLEQIKSVKMIFMVWTQKTSYKIFLKNKIQKQNSRDEGSLYNTENISEHWTLSAGLSLGVSGSLIWESVPL